MYSIELNIWVPHYAMSDAEKAANHNWQTNKGYLKSIPPKEAWKNAWNNWDDDSKKAFTSLENFDAKIFEEITGIVI